ncbi:MAG: flagellar filament capping protein FliD, partial [Candidatus Zixiibacteriota bacterium]
MSGTQTIEGLASNLDITSIVDTIMSYERYPVTLLEEQKEYKTQQVAAYQAVLAKFIALQSQVSLMKKESSYNKAAIDVSDESILTATADGRVSTGSYNVSVLSLARSHQIASNGVSDSTTGVFGTGTIKISVGSASTTTINIDSENNSLISIKNAINDANAGVTASIINDGTSSNPYRLLITANKTGASNVINLDIGLTGGEILDFENSTFDSPEMIKLSSETTSNISLGSTASYSGSANKLYTFTVGGSGTQTIGSDIITLNWSDGTNSGTILVTQADSEVELTGMGADGLKLSFTAGQLAAGDTFQVAGFAPLLQNASDARLAVGGDSTNGGSPIIINSATNHFDDIIPGVSLDVKKTTDPGESITISTDIDTDAIKTMVNDFVTKYNDVMSFIDDQFTYEADTQESGVLFADYSLQIMQSTLRSATTRAIKELTGG